MALEVRTESAEQRALFEWAALREGKWPELSLLHHIPNGGSRNKAEAARLKLEGVKAGVPDIHLPVARGPYHSLYIEMKRVKGGRVSPAQKLFMRKAEAYGNKCVVCRGFDEAVKAITDYMELEAKA